MDLNVEIVPLSPAMFEWLVTGQVINAIKGESPEIGIYQCSCGECLIPNGLEINVN